MKLLREFVSLDYKDNLIEEAKKSLRDRTPLCVPAILQRSDVPNQNERIYPKTILEREVNNYNKAVMEGRSGGELDHPESSVVSLQNVSHRIKEQWWQENTVHGLVEIHPSLPKGPAALGLLEAGLKVGISSRGIGDTIKNDEGFSVVDESFMLIAYDLVSEPSTHEAWLMKECKNVSMDEVKKAISKTQRLQRIVNEILG